MTEPKANCSSVKTQFSYVYREDSDQAEHHSSTNKSLASWATGKRLKLTFVAPLDAAIMTHLVCIDAGVTLVVIGFKIFPTGAPDTCATNAGFRRLQP